MSKPSHPTRMRPSMPVTATTPTITPIMAMGLTIIPIMGMIIMFMSIAIIPTIGAGAIRRTTTITPASATATATVMDKGAAEPDAALLPLLWLSPTFRVGSFAYSHGLE